LRTILYVVTLPLATVWYGMRCIVASWFRIRRVPGGVYDRAQHNFGRVVLAASGVRVKLEGAQHIRTDRPQVIASNHASFFDILAYLGHLPVDPKFVAKKELFGIPVFGAAIAAAGHVRIDRQNLKEAFGAYEEAARRIREERLHVLVYPEGTRSRTGELLPFKKGPFVLAIGCQAEIVPAFAHGAFGIQPKGSVRVRPRPITLILGEPIPTAGLGYGDRDAVAQRVREAVLALKARAETSARVDSREGPG
jgi:1-acyl-sn-glycerol-3-phosphate acyltransferase